MIPRLLLSSLPFLLLVPCAFAQETPTVVGETVQVNLVEIPVNVVDRNGEPVRGLQAENFEVFDDSQKRKITHFEEIDLARISTDPKEVFNPVVRRNFLMVFDLSNSSPKALVRARDSARRFVETLRERDLVAVSTFSIETGFRILSAFTTDRELVYYAIRTLGHPRFYDTYDPLQLYVRVDPGMGDPGQISAASEFEAAIIEAQDIFRVGIQGHLDEYGRGRIDRQLGSFAHMARLLDSVSGRKQMILLSEGFDARLVHGRERPLSYEEQEKELLSLSQGQIWRIDNDQRFGNVRSINDVQQMGQLFRRSDVVLHAIDIRGIPTAADARTGARVSTSESHFLLADPTGGEVFKNSNDLPASFARILKQQEVVYVLGFQTKPSGSPGKYHDLTVKVKLVGVRGLRVNHRAGYYEPRLQISVVEQRLSATDILMNDIPYEDVEVNLLAVPFPTSGGNAQVPVIAEISGADLLQGVSGDQLNLELFVYAFDERSRVKDFLFQTVSLELPKIRAMLNETGIKYYGTLSLPPGDYSIKSLVRVVETGNNGFRRLHLKVPSHGERSVLPPLVFEDPGRWLMLKGAKTAEGQVDYPFTLVQESFIPSARPRMKRGETYKIAVFTYNVPPEQMELIVRLQGADGTQRNPSLKLLGRTATGNDGGVKLLLGFTPEDVGPGDYSLHVAIRDQKEASSTEVSIPLEIEGPAGL